MAVHGPSITGGTYLIYSWHMHRNVTYLYTHISEKHPMMNWTVKGKMGICHFNGKVTGDLLSMINLELPQENLLTKAKHTIMTSP